GHSWTQGTNPLLHKYCCETKGASMSETKRVLRAPKAAKYTGLSESTLAKRRLYGLPPEYLSLGGRAIGYMIDQLDRWLETLPAPVNLATAHNITNGGRMTWPLQI